jgi:hypothetical protein
MSLLFFPINNKNYKLKKFGKTSQTVKYTLKLLL